MNNYLNLPAAESMPPLTIPAGETHVLNVTGQYVRCLECNHASFTLKLNDNGTEMFFRAGSRVTIPPASEAFQSIHIHNPNSSAMTVNMVWGFGEYEDDTVSQSGSVDSQAVIPPVIDDDPNKSLANEALTVLFNDDPQRAVAYITNLEPVGGAMLYVGAAPTDGRGIPLAPQATLPIATTAKMRGWHDKGAGETVDVALFYTKWA